MNKLEQAARQVLQHWASSEDLVGAITALREALAEQALSKVTSDEHCKGLGEELHKLAEQAEQESKCKDHPDAPHGFCRDESITQDRYVCECEFWEPPEQAEQEPVAEVENIDEYGPMICWFKHWVGLKVGQKLYAAPVRTKDLTDDEIGSIYEKHHALGGCWTDGFAYERAVIAADRWKNK